MKKSLLAGTAALLLFAGSFLAVFLYNYWSWCGGRCNAAILLNPGPPGLILIALTLLGLAVLAGLRLYADRRQARHRCACGTYLAAEWAFCPQCGKGGAAHSS